MTTFSVAATDQDYDDCRRLMLAEDSMPHAAGMGFPTVIARDDHGELVGFIATALDDDMVIAGPFVVKSDKRRTFTGLRLAEMYRNTMLDLGITSIVFSAEEGESVIARSIKRWFPEMKPYSSNGSMSFYMWPLDKKFLGD